jgi:hypothetical protein
VATIFLYALSYLFLSVFLPCGLLSCKVSLTSVADWESRWVLHYPYCGRLKADSDIPCRSPAMPCHAMPLRVYTASFPFALHSAAVFESNIPYPSHTVPLQCHEYAVLKATSQGHGRVATGERHGMYELASAVQRRHVGDLFAFGTVGEWQGRGRGTAWYVWISL